MRPETQRPTALRPTPHRQYTAPEPGTAPTPAEQARPGLYPGEPETCRRDSRQFLPILAHLGLFLAVFKVYRVEGRAFQLLVALALAALPVHYLLPYRWKKPLFVAVSIAGLALGLRRRYGRGVVLALAAAPDRRLPPADRLGGPGRDRRRRRLRHRPGSGPRASPRRLPESVWPVLATMFMFRIMIYLYELKHAKRPESLVDTLSYFFLLPNYCFLHFPVVDYRTLQRGYFARDIHATQRAGLPMMFRRHDPPAALPAGLPRVC